MVIFDPATLKPAVASPLILRGTGVFATVATWLSSLKRLMKGVAASAGPPAMVKLAAISAHVLRITISPMDWTRSLKRCRPAAKVTQQEPDQRADGTLPQWPASAAE